MKTLLVACAVVACAIGATLERARKAEKPSTCVSDYEKYKEIYGVHTMCDFFEVAAGDVTSEEIQIIVNKHNELRATEKTAKQMCKMYWDPEIAKIAEHYARACPTPDWTHPHDNSTGRRNPGDDIGVGQNIAWGYEDWAGAIIGWYEEIKDFEYGKGSVNGKAVGHYTQVVKDTACRVGCGFANCPDAGNNLGRTFVCNYMTGQQNYKTPFVQGSKQCEGCKKCSEDGLCDCEGKMCYHKGTLDMSTCSCSCPSPFTGEFCEKMDCASSPDASYCNSPAPYGFPPEYCTKYSNVPRDCPRMCGLCTEDNEPGHKFFESSARHLIAGDGTTGTGSNTGGTGSNTGGTGSNTGGTESNTGDAGSNTVGGNNGAGCNKGEQSFCGNSYVNKRNCGKDPASGYSASVLTMTYSDGRKVAKPLDEWCPETCDCWGST